MTVTVTVKDVHISRTTPGQGGVPTIHTGIVDIAISTPGQPVVLSIKFQDIQTLDQAVTIALRTVADWGLEVDRMARPPGP